MLSNTLFVRVRCVFIVAFVCAIIVVTYSIVRPIRPVRYQSEAIKYHLRQLASAIHQYRNTHGVLPAKLSALSKWNGEFYIHRGPDDRTFTIATPIVQYGPDGAFQYVCDEGGRILQIPVEGDAGKADGRAPISVGREHDDP